MPLSRITFSAEVIEVGMESKQGQGIHCSPCDDDVMLTSTAVGVAVADFQATVQDECMLPVQSKETIL